MAFVSFECQLKPNIVLWDLGQEKSITSVHRGFHWFDDGVHNFWHFRQPRVAKNLSRLGKGERSDSSSSLATKLMP